MDKLAKGIQDFLYQWHFSTNEFYRSLNPRFEPFGAGSPAGLIALLRVSVPAIGKTRSARVADAIRVAGYVVEHDESGCYLAKDTAPERETLESAAALV